MSVGAESLKETTPNPNNLSKQFAIELVELADRYDSLDHDTGPLGGSALQGYCHAVRELARSIPFESEQPEEPQAAEL